MRAGVTLRVPLGRATAPTPLSIVSEVAFCVDHESVAVPPAMMVAGSAVSVSVGSGCVTLIVTLALLVPPGPVAVSV